ncbi:MAG: hypothetical protein KTR15_08050 [Phycisphaeraceae bacterium]|nr:hypothetical protein [Phycisphaeraceae bacterium]
MLLALTLTSLLTAALSLMIGQAAREREAMREQTHDPAWSGQLFDLLERDLKHAQWWAGSEERIVLIGLGRDSLPAQIEYRWIEQDSGNVLIRKQVSLTDGPPGRDKPEPRVVGVDLEGFDIGPFGFGERLYNDGLPDSNPPINLSPPTLLIDGQKVPLRQLPDQIAIRLLAKDENRLGFRREVALR